MELLIYFIALVLVALSGLTIVNVLTFPRLKRRVETIQEQPFVSILIPARNEADVIGQTVTRLLAQTYKNFELIVLDDNSTDGTGQILQQFDDHRLTVISGQPLPSDWMGKSWACHQLAQNATGEILIFTDADVQWSPTALSVVISQQQHTNADLFTVWSTQQTITQAERLTVPLMAFAILTYLPTFMTHYSPFSAFAAANGQCMVWKRSVYQAIGGHKAVSNNVLDDVNHARLIKHIGYNLRMVDGNQLISCRMYDGWDAVRDGFAKNILAGYGNSVIALSLAIVFHFIVFLLPILIAVFSPEYRLWAILFIVQAMLIRSLSASFTHQRIQDAIGMPISVVLMTLISIQSIIWHYTGGPRWKGRIIQTKTTHKGQAHV